MVFAMVGVLMGAGAAPHIVEWAGGGRHGYGVMAMVIAAGCGLAMFVTYLTIRRHHLRDRLDEKPRIGFRRGLARVLANRPYVRLWFVYLLALSGAAMFTAMVPYFVTRVMGQSEGAAGTALLAMLCGTIISLPAWSAAIRRADGRHLLAIAILAYALVAGAFFVVPPNLSTTGVAPLYFVLGVPFAGLQLLPFILLAHIAHDDARTGIRQEGLFTGIWTAGEKLALAIGPAAAGVGLTLAGYVAGASSQTPQTLSALRIVMAAGPALFMLPALMVIFLGKRSSVPAVAA
jgi:Na+/melibiose symporter-like transporter